LFVTDAALSNSWLAASGDIWAAAWSPDGTKVAYIRHLLADPSDQWSAINSDLVVASSQDWQVLLLIHQEKNLDELAWSPDARLLAYGWSNGWGGVNRIHALDIERDVDYPLVASDEATRGVWAATGSGTSTISLPILSLGGATRSASSPLTEQPAAC
jgi:hypothetical protein